MTPLDQIRHQRTSRFLAQHDDVLVRHAVLAERYVVDDPNSALIKLCQLSELLAQDTRAFTVGIVVPEGETHQTLIDKL